MTLSNLFDSDNYPDEVPSELPVGGRWAWKRSAITAAYPTSLYTLKYHLVQLTSSAQATIDITAAKTGDEHIIEVAIGTTGGYTAAEYQWQEIIERDSDNEQIVLTSGVVELTPDLDAAADVRSHNYTVLKAIEATIENTATKEQSSYTIAGRSLSRRSIEELLILKREYARLWHNEKRAADRKAGRTTTNNVLIRMKA